MSFKRLGRQKGNDYPAGLNVTKYGNYQVTKSLRFRRANSAYLNRTQSSGNRKTWTWSGWIKRGLLKTQQTLFSAATWDGSYNRYMQVTWDYTTDSIDYLQFDSSTGSVEYRLTTTPVYTDPAAWYHVVCVFDSTQSTSTNRMKIYVNGTQVTAFSTSSYPTLNFDGAMNYSSRTAYIGALMYNGSMINFMDGLMTEIVFVDGQALTPSSFGATDSTTGQWQPVAYTGTYGTNGYYLPFTDTTSTFTLGNDAGNGNNWTLNNFSLTAGATYDSMTDVPTLTSSSVANYCTLNPLKRNVCTISNANLTASGPSQYTKSVTSTMSMPPGSGKFYWEVVFTRTSTSDGGVMPGIVSKTWSPGEATGSPSVYPGNSSDSWGVNGNDGSKINNSSSTSYGSSFASGDVIMLAYDAINGSFFVGKNGTWFDNGDPATNTRSAYTGITTEVIPAFGMAYDSGSSIANVNFGQRAFSYTPPTGFNTLCTYNLPDPTIKQPNKQFDVSLWNGTKQPQNITNSGFQPDAVWIKSRSVAYDHNFWNSITGNSRFLIPNKSNAEVSTITDGLMSFNSNGFSVGSDINGIVNDAAPTKTYVAWQWKANGTAVSNLNGTITSQVSANPAAGFSVATYTGTGTAATIGHGLGVKPKFIIVKCRSNATTYWWTYSESNGIGNLLQLDSIDASSADTGGGIWNNTSPTTSVFSIGSNNQINGDGRTYVAYCWSEVPGYSSFGSYTGNGSTDGPFMYCGFKPKWIMIKRTDTTGNWCIHDTLRPTYNGTSYELYPNLNYTEGTSSGPDKLSNGFKLRDTYSDVNSSGGTYIYAAFAEYPFKNGNAAIYNIN